jgi:hypothetical protein
MAPVILERFCVKILHMLLAVFTGRLAGSLFVSVTSTDGQLCMGFSYNENLLSTPVMKQIVEEVKRLINVIIS